MFICNTRPTPRECCIKLTLPNITVIIKKVALDAGVGSTAVNSWLLRRSTISSAWRENSDSVFRQELFQLAGHSYETARRYYATYDATEQSRRVICKLAHYRTWVFIFNNDMKYFTKTAIILIIIMFGLCMSFADSPQLRVLRKRTRPKVILRSWWTPARSRRPKKKWMKRWHPLKIRLWLRL